MPYRPVSRQPRVIARVAVRNRTPWWFELPLVLVSTVVGAAVDQAVAGLVSGVTFVLFRRIRTA